LSELTGPERWFERAAPALTLLLADPKDASVVEWYFTCFSFKPGTQQPVLLWLNEIMLKHDVAPEVLEKIVDRILLTSEPHEAEWIYRRALELLRQRSDDSAFRAFVLHVGRLSYSAGRPDKRPTVYDEQAIANDIAMARP
jgi:hypothetical protein